MTESEEGGSRRYDPEEIDQIFERAAELERRGAPGSRGRSGMSITEIQEIGAEAGLDPVLLRQAAHELDVGVRRQPTGAADKWLGAPLHLVLERVLRVEVEEELFERLVPMIQVAADGIGQASVIGRTLTWQSADSQRQRQLNITVTSRDGETTVRIEESYNALAGGTFGGLMGGLGAGVGFGVGLPVGLAALGSVLFATVFPVAALSGAYLLARTVYRTTVAGRRRVLTGLLERVAGEVDAMARRALGEGSAKRLRGPGEDPERAG